MAIDDREPSASDRTDALKVIKGIGPTFARALNKLGVMKLEDLLAYTPEELSEALLKEAGLRVPPERIAGNDWIGQARRLVEESSQPAEAGNETAETPVQVDEEQSSWRQQAGFSLFFDYLTTDDGESQWQTRVYHDESGEEAQFHGTDATAWINWVLERAELPELDAELPEPAGPADDEAPVEETWRRPTNEADWIKVDALVDILDVQVAAADPATVGGPEKLLTSVYFQVVGVEAISLVQERAQYRVEVRAIDLETGKPAYVKAKVDSLAPNAPEHTVQLALPLPQVGRYELHSVVHLLPPANVRSFYEGPTVRIVA